MNLKEIVEKHVRENGFGGLCDDAGGRLCCCRLDHDFMHCGEPEEHCEPGYVFECDKCPKADPRVESTIYSCDVECSDDNYPLPQPGCWCIRVDKVMDKVAPADFLKERS